jgi:hypothetical protein
MQFVVVGRDKGDGALRRAERPAQPEDVAAREHLLLYVGRLIEHGRMIGSLFVLDLPDRVALDAYPAADPCFTLPIFETVEVYESRRMSPEAEPGSSPPRQNAPAGLNSDEPFPTPAG